MAPNLIAIHDLAFSYPEQFADVTGWKLYVKQLVIPSNTVCHVIGGNMVGKTTLLRILAGLERVSFSSDTHVFGDLIFQNGRHQKGACSLRLRNTFFLSHSDRMFPELTIWENVRLARNCGILPRRDAYERFRLYMSGLRILHGKPERTRLGALSSGGQALIRLARAYSWGGQLILVDEVTAHLDDESAELFFRNLEILLKDGCSVILVSHDQRDHILARNLASPSTHSKTIAIELKDNTSCVTEPSFS